MLLNWLYVWMQWPEWLLLANSWIGYVADLVFSGLFLLWAVYATVEVNRGDRRWNAQRAIVMLGLDLASVSAGILGPIIVGLIYLICVIVRESFYDRDSKKWTLNPK